MKSSYNPSLYTCTRRPVLQIIILTTLMSVGSLPAMANEPASEEFGLIGIEKREHIRVVYDVRDDVWSAGIGKALYYVRGLVEAYRSQGVPPEKLHVSVVIAGKAAYWLLDDAAYQEYKNDEFTYNPNRQVVEELIGLGVSVELCNATRKGRGWQVEELLPGVKRVHDGYTRLIDLQQKGYAYIRF
jgi:uncharacterized protein